MKPLHEPNNTCTVQGGRENSLKLLGPTAGPGMPPTGTSA